MHYANAMHAAEIVLPIFKWALIVILAVAFIYALGICSVMAYDQIKESRVRWSHIKAAFFMAAEFIIYKVTRAKNAGRHAVKIKKDDISIATFWTEVKAEFEALPYSLSRVNNVHDIKHA